MFGSPGRKFSHFADFSPKIGKNHTFRDPGVTHLPEVWKFLTEKPIHATNFWPKVVWDGPKYQWYFGLSWTLVYPNEKPVLKMAPEIVHLRSSRKWSKSRQFDEVFGQFLPDFQQNLAKTINFTAQRAKQRPGPPFSLIFSENQ